MKIAILSWGSLIRTGVERGLRIRGGWQTGGPIIPIEFSRVSQSGERTGCLTLVVDEKNGVNVPTYYAESALTNLDHTLANLRLVENITLVYSVGYVNLVRNSERGWAREHHPITCNTIKAWAATNGFDAVVWTSLLSNFEKVTNIPFSVQSAVDYINSLSPGLKEKAMEYINNAPFEVVTPVRTAVCSNIPRTEAPQTVPMTDDEIGELSLMNYLRRFRRLPAEGVNPS